MTKLGVTISTDRETEARSLWQHSDFLKLWNGQESQRSASDAVSN